MTEYFIVSRQRSDTDSAGVYRSMTIVSSRAYTSQDDAWSQARTLERDHLENERQMKDRGMLDGVIIPTTNYHVLSQEEINEGRRRGIQIY